MNNNVRFPFRFFIITFIWSWIIWLEGLCSPHSWKQIRNMVRKHNFGDYMGFLASPFMVHNRYKSNLYEFRGVYTPDRWIFFHFILDSKNLRQQAILRTLCSWPF